MPRVRSPRDIVYHSNSDSDHIILLIPTNSEYVMLYAGKGMYDGFIVKPQNGIDTNSIVNAINSNIARAFYVAPEIEGSRVGDDYGELPWSRFSKDYGNIIEQFRAMAERLPKDVKEFFDFKEYMAYIEIVRYRYTAIRPIVDKAKDTYVVLNFEPLQPPRVFTGVAARMIVYHSGSRRRPACPKVRDLVRAWKHKYPDNDVVQQLYVIETDDSPRTCGIGLKIAVEAPAELLPVAVAGATQQNTVNQNSTSEPRAVIVKGFLVLSRLPSKSLLDAHLPEIFKDVKIGRKEIKLVMGYFYNKLGTLSRKFYNQILARHAVYAGFGYIVPYDRVPQFLAEVDKLKKEYEKYERQLKEFLLEGKIPPEVASNKRAKIDREYVELVMEYLREHGKDEEVRKKIENLDIVGRVRINLLPFAIDMSLVEEYIDEKVKERIERELTEVRRQIIDAARQDLEERARKLLEKAERLLKAEIAKMRLEQLRREVEDLEKMAEEFGIEHLPSLERLKAMLEGRIEEERPAKSERLKAMLEG